MDKNLRYRKVHCCIWVDDKFPYLSDEAKLVFFIMMTTTFSTPFGCFKAGKAALLEESRTDPKGFSKGFAELLQKGLVKYDDKTLTVLLPGFLKYNKPANPNVVKKWGKVFAWLPAGFLKDEIFSLIKECCETLGKGFSKGFTEGFSEPYGNTENREQRTEIKKELYSGKKTREQNPVEKPLKKPVENIPYKKIICFLNETAKTAFKETTQATRSKIKARFREGFSLDDFKLVIVHQVDEWETDEKMNMYLRPDTLFSGKFEGYLQAAKKNGAATGTGRFGKWNSNKEQ